MTQYLKDLDKLRSLVRGIEADLKSMETSTERTFPRLRSKLKKSLEEFSSDITNLYPYLEETTIAPLDLEKRKDSISELEATLRTFESKFSLLEANPPPCSEDQFDTSESIESLLKNRRMHTFETDYKPPALVQEIDYEVSDSAYFSIPSIKVYFSSLSEVQIVVLIGVVLLLLIWLITS